MNLSEPPGRAVTYALRPEIAAPGSGVVGTEATNMSATSIHPATDFNPAIQPIPGSHKGAISAILRAIFHDNPVALPAAAAPALACLTPDKILRRIAGTAGKWKKQQAAAVLHWPRISEAELLWSDGHVERLTGLVQQHYEISGSNAERQVKRFFELNVR
jgi:hypothetical protein